MEDAELIIQKQVNQVVVLQKEVEAKILALKETQDAITNTWNKVQEAMIAHDIKSIKGDFGSITIAERLNWDYDPTMLPAKFFKKVVDTKRLSDTFRLEGKAPKGATPSYTKYITKRIK